MISVSERAAARIREIVQAHPDELGGLRVGLQDGGCSGYTYLLDFEVEPEDEDLVVEHGGARVFVHPLHIPFLQGSTLHFAEAEFQSGFHLDNPNVKRLCGCGESFDV